MQPRVTCRENRYHVIRNGRGFIAGPIADVSGGEGGVCILVFNVPNGQRLNITLFDFAPTRNLKTGDFISSEDRPPEDHQDPTSTTQDYPHKNDHRPRDHPPRDSPPGELLPSNNSTTPVSVVLRIVCRQYAVIREPATGLSVQVCGGGGDQTRERHVYLSRSNLVHLQLLTWPQVNAAVESQNFGQVHLQPVKYLLQYEGCSLLVINLKNNY